MTERERVKAEFDWESLTEEEKSVLENLELDGRTITHSDEWIAKRRAELDIKKKEFKFSFRQ